jgi:signal transduction histidine kinase/PAS domain-containing protein
MRARQGKRPHPRQIPTTAAKQRACRKPAWFSHRADHEMEATRRARDGGLATGGEMGELFRATDWNRTPLGPVASWPQCLRTAISMMLEAEFAIAIAWGPEFRLFYNDRYRPIIGAKHPALGKPTAEIFPEIWDLVGPEFARAGRGEAIALDDWYLPLVRSCYLESCWFSVSFSPIRDDAGEVGGLFAIVVETTARVEGDRRLATLRELAAQAADARSPEQACANAARALERNPTDVPFAIVYALDDDGRTARRLAQVGLPADHAAAPETVELAPDGSGSPTQAARGWPLARAARSAIVVDDLAARFGALPGGEAPESAHTAVLLPLVGAGLGPRCVLVAGVSPRRALDDRYRGFFELVADHISTAIGSAHWREAQRRRADELASVVAYNEKFTAILGHDLRNPLNAITTAAQLLERRAAVPEIARPAQRIVFSVERMSRMIAQLLDLARVRVTGLQLRRRDLDLAELCQLVLDELRQGKPGSRIELGTVGPLRGRWDGDRLAQVISNLAGNALEHGEPGAAVRVQLDGRDPDRVALQVENRGAIDGDVLPTLFDPFRGARHRRENTRGLGLGLYISKEIVTAHGGTIDVRSSAEGGTRFAIELPRNPNTAALQIVEGNPPRGESRQG